MTASQTDTPPKSPAPPRFVTGSLMRHIVVMAGTGAIGLVAIFAVDLINLLYISMLGEQAIAAAVGFAGVVGFFLMSIFIGMLIGITAVVSRAVGAHQTAEARAVGTSSLVITAVMSVVLTALTMVFLHPLLELLGARDRVLELAYRFLLITLPSTTLLGMGMACSALLRSVGDARRSMMVTLVPAIVTAALDPIFIFVFGLGLDGAAIVVVLPARCWPWAVRRRGAICWRFDRTAWRRTTLFVVAGRPF